MDSPFILIREQGGDKTMEGTAHCALGHRIAMMAGQKDEGVFAEWRWDGASLKIENDRLGFQPLFYYQRDGEIAVSPSIWALMKAGVPLDYDYEALAVFFHFGHFVGNDTPFMGIRAVPPNSSITWQGGELSFGGGYALPVARDISRKDAIEAYMASLRNALQRRPPDGVTAMPLSGGRDSRLLLFELVRAGHRPDFCITHDRKTDTDIEVARQIAGRLNIPLVETDGEDRSTVTYRRKLIAASFCAMPGDIMWQLRTRMAGHARTVYDGIGGDTPTTTASFQTPRRLELFRAGRLDELVADITSFKGTGNPILAPEFRAIMGYDVAAERLVRELAIHKDAPNPVASFYFWNRARRKLAQAHLSILADIPRVHTPFLDREILDLLFSIPAESQMDFGFRDAVLTTAHPEFSDIPFARKVPGAGRKRRPPARIGQAMLTELARYGLPEFFNGNLIWPRLFLLASGLPAGGDKHWYLNHLMYGHCLERAVREAGR